MVQRQSALRVGMPFRPVSCNSTSTVPVSFPNVVSAVHSYSSCTTVVVIYYKNVVPAVLNPYGFYTRHTLGYPDPYPEEPLPWVKGKGFSG